MNVYDFDKTIYDGDSSIDFCLFCYRVRKKTIIYFPRQVIAYLLYKMNVISKIQAKEAFFSLVKGLDDIDSIVNDFWNKYEKKIQTWYLKQKLPTDIIISASPDFLLKPLISKLGISQVIATEVSKENGTFLSKNCYGEEKVIRFKEIFPTAIPDTFYSDSISDKPMMLLSKQAFLVKKNKRIAWK